MTKKKTKVAEEGQAGAARVVDYSAIKTVSEKVSLADIQTMSFSADALRPLAGTLASELDQRIGVRGRLLQTAEDTAIVLIEFDYNAEMGANQIARVQGSLIVIYTLQPDTQWEDLPTETVEQFSEVNGIYNTWSYIRELVASSLTRLGLAGVLLPLWRPPHELPPPGEFAELRYTREADPGSENTEPE